jgi:hypothetical protein
MGPIDVGIAAAHNEFWKDSLLSVNGKSISGMGPWDFIKFGMEHIDGAQLRGAYSDRFSPGPNTGLKRVVHKCPCPFTDVFLQHETVKITLR